MKMSDFKLALIIDAQEDFMDPDGALPVPGADAVVPILNEYLSSLTLENGYIGAVFTADTHDEETYPNSPEANGDPDNGIPGFPPHCYTGTDGFKFAVDPSLIPKDEEDGSKIDVMILNKGVFNMWEEDNLAVRPYKVTGEIIAYRGEQDRDTFFNNLITAGIDEVEVVGVAADYCVKWAIDGLVARGFKVIVYDNLTAGIERDIHQVVAEDFVGEDVTVS